MREEKLRVAGMQVAPSFAPGPSAEAPPERGGFVELGRRADTLPFHGPVKSSLNPSASRAAGSRSGYPFQSFCHIGGRGGRFRSLALTR